MPKSDCCQVHITRDMGVLKWLKRERVTLTGRRGLPIEPEEIDSRPFDPCHSEDAIGTIRTEDYKRDLAEFQARRSSGQKELPDTPEKKRCGRHSLPASCTDCATPDYDKTFNYEKKSANKYKKNKSYKRTQDTSQDMHDGISNVQFLFQNQVFMPGGTVYHQPSYSEPYKSKANRERQRRRDDIEDYNAKKQIEFQEQEEDVISPPLFYKNNSLPIDPIDFLECRNEEVDGYAKVSCKYNRSSFNNKDGSHEDKLAEVMQELNNFDKWADENLNGDSQSSMRTDDNKSNASANGLPIVSSSDLDVEIDRNRTWNSGNWGTVRVQIKRLTGVTIQHVKKKLNVEVNILRKCRHPNIILLMAVFPDVYGNIYIVCEGCVDSLFAVLHVQGRILSAQTSVQYANDIASALVFLRMRGYLHSSLTSHSVMLTDRGTAKLADCGPCAVLPQKRVDNDCYKTYLTQNYYANIQDFYTPNGGDCDPLISNNPSSVYLTTNAVAKEYKSFAQSEYYRWQAPELFEQDEHGLVHVCSKSDVYALSLILWECCNASVPWKTMTYENLKDLYIKWGSGIRLPSDGTYPGCLLELLQGGLRIDRFQRSELQTFADRLRKVKQSLDNMEYIVIPSRMNKKHSTFSSQAWDSSPTNSDCQSPPKNAYTKPRNVKQNTPSSTSSCKSDALYETIHSDLPKQFEDPPRCFINDDLITLKYDSIKQKEYSSACSTPKAKAPKDISFPRSDSTEYCSILSPEYRSMNKELNCTDNKVPIGKEVIKLTKSFTPQSYKPLHITVPEVSVESVKALAKDQSDCGPSYTFDIKNYTLPNTPIARSNKLRKNAWLAGELRSVGDLQTSGENVPVPEIDKDKENEKEVKSTPNICEVTSSIYKTTEKEQAILVTKLIPNDGRSNSVDVVPNFAQFRKSLTTQESPPCFDRERTQSWSFRTSERSPRILPSEELLRPQKKFPEEEVLTSVNVKPLVAIHERWILEANKKRAKPFSLPEDTSRSSVPAVKPASHCDSLPTSSHSLNGRKNGKYFKNGVLNNSRNGRSEMYCTARDNIARCMAFNFRDKKDAITSTSSIQSQISKQEPEIKVDQTTDTDSIEDFIKDLIKKEFQHLMNEVSTEKESNSKNDILSKGIRNVIESLKGTEQGKQDSTRQISKLKINGNNKPLLQITFAKSGESSLQVLDNSLNVTYTEKRQNCQDDLLNESSSSIKRCQTFGALQEARSTEDLYIDDDLSTHMQENFGGKVKLIPLHGSLHEILCEREDDCCLIKVKKENGCDTIYFKCDNSDTESRDDIDGHNGDTVVYKRSISLVEEKIHRVNRNKKPTITKKKVVTKVEKNPETKPAPRKIETKMRRLSLSSPTLNVTEDEVEMSIDNAMCYDDSSSEECVRCNTDDEFEFLEKEIEKSVAETTKGSVYKYNLDKISEESLSVIDDSYEQAQVKEFTRNTL